MSSVRVGWRFSLMYRLFIRVHWHGRLPVWPGYRLGRDIFLIFRPILRPFQPFQSFNFDTFTFLSVGFFSRQ